MEHMECKLKAAQQFQQCLPLKGEEYTVCKQNSEKVYEICMKEEFRRIQAILLPAD